jgi:hypothetical protein
MTMSLPVARTFDEIFLFMELRPCVCGETRFEDRTSATVTVAGAPAERFTGRCAGCGRPRQFTFRLPDSAPTVSPEVRYGPDGLPSSLLDAGEWLGVSELYELGAREELDELDPGDEARVTRAYYLLTSARAALDEVVKFLPDGADAVPEGAFWSQPGRLVYEATPDRFTRERLSTDRAELRDRIANTVERYLR